MITEIFIYKSKFKAVIIERFSTFTFCGTFSRTFVMFTIPLIPAFINLFAIVCASLSATVKMAKLIFSRFITKSISEAGESGKVDRRISTRFTFESKPAQISKTELSKRF